MNDQPALAAFKVGDVVRILNSAYEKVRIAEDRGLLGPQGARIYRVRVQKRPHLAYIEVREDQLERVAAG